MPHPKSAAASDSTAKAKHVHWEMWAKENNAAMQADNRRSSDEGLPLAKYRSFARCLGNGKKD